MSRPTCCFILNLWRLCKYRLCCHVWYKLKVLHWHQICDCWQLQTIYYTESVGIFMVYSVPNLMCLIPTLLLLLPPPHLLILLVWLHYPRRISHSPPAPCAPFNCHQNVKSLIILTYFCGYRMCLLPQGKNTGWGCSKIGCWGRYLNLRWIK